MRKIRYIIKRKIQYLENKIDGLIKTERYDEALHLIRCISELKYLHNVEYTDDYLESCIQIIAEACGMSVDKTPKNDKNTVLFYDGFGLDFRGIALIYLKALLALDYQVVYVVSQKRVSSIPGIRKLIDQGNGIIEIINNSGYINVAYYLLSLLKQYSPRAAFLYCKPEDVSAVMAFDYAPTGVTRFQLNLTDHTFWLGTRAFDYCIEFRNYGAYLSSAKRGIAQQKLVIQPYYPIINRNTDFQGYPFCKEKDDLLIFSGGALYKTISKDNNLYYRVIDRCLQKYGNIKFWYAGNGDDTYLKKLKIKYPYQVFYTNERNDLFQIMQNTDIYLNSYPISGALMVQYAAVAGTVPMTLMHDSEALGILFEQESLGISYYDYDMFEKEIFRLIDDEAYRKEKEKRLACVVIKEREFTENLGNIIEKHYSNYELDVMPVDTSKFEETREYEFGRFGVECVLASRKYWRLKKVFIFYYLYSVFIKVIYKIWKKIRAKI